MSIVLKQSKFPISFSPNINNVKLKDNWQCLPDYSFPVKRIDNKIACMSTDGLNCLWGFCSSHKTYPEIIRPYICTEGNYKNPSDWCSRVDKILSYDAGAFTKFTRVTRPDISQPGLKKRKVSQHGYENPKKGLCISTSKSKTTASSLDYNISKSECRFKCTGDKACMGYSYSFTGNCQIYNAKGQYSTLKKGETLNNGNGDKTWQCYIKRPKVKVLKGLTNNLNLKGSQFQTI